MTQLIILGNGFDIASGLARYGTLKTGHGEGAGERERFDTTYGSFLRR